MSQNMILWMVGAVIHLIRAVQTSAMNPKSINEANKVMSLIDARGLREKPCIVAAPQKGIIEPISIKIALLKYNAK